MMRVLEIIVALIIVAILGVVVGYAMPGTGHVERSLVVGKDFRQVYDVMDNLRRFPDYSTLSSDDPNIKYTLSGPAYGPGATLSWTSNDDKVGDGKLTIVSATPDFSKINPAVNHAQIVWNLDNDWYGTHKRFTIDLERRGNTGKLTRITWSYDVSYGLNLFGRYSRLYIHGAPDTMIQYSLANLQNVLAAVPNVDYSDLIPYIVKTQPAPVLLESASVQRKDGLAGFDDTVDGIVNDLNAAARKLGVHVTGPRIVFTTNYGDETYTFDVALPIDATSLTLGGQSYALTLPTQPSISGGAAPASSSSAPASASSSAPASASSSASAAAPTLNPGDHDRFGQLVVNDKVRAALEELPVPSSSAAPASASSSAAPAAASSTGGVALQGVWNGTFAGVPLTRNMLEAYAQTHGYMYDDVVHRMYDIEVQPGVQDKAGNVTSYPKFDVYLPITNSPDGGTLPQKTPEQAEGIPQPSLQPASSSTAPAPASSAAPAKAASSK